MSTAHETCPHCGADAEPRDFSRDTGFNGVRYECGNVKYDASVGAIRVSTCYERELAASRAECAALRGALEKIANDCPCDNDGRGCPCEDVATDALAKLNAAFGAGKEGGSQ